MGGQGRRAGLPKVRPGSGPWPERSTRNIQLLNFMLKLLNIKLQSYETSTRDARDVFTASWPSLAL